MSSVPEEDVENEEISVTIEFQSNNGNTGKQLHSSELLAHGNALGSTSHAQNGQTILGNASASSSDDIYLFQSVRHTVDDDGSPKPVTPRKVSDFDEDDQDVVDGGDNKDNKSFLDLRPHNSLSESVITSASVISEHDFEENGSSTQGEPFADFVRYTPSPPSSQGSIDSGEYVYQQLRAIENKAEQMNNLKLHLDVKNILSKQEHSLIRKYFADRNSVHRFISFFKNDLMSTAFYTGTCQPHSEEAKTLQEQLTSRCPDKMLEIINYVLLENFGSSEQIPPYEGTPNKEDEHMETDEQCGTNCDESGRQLTTRLFGADNNGHEHHIGSNNSKDVKVLVQPVTSSAVVAAITGPENNVPGVPNFLPSTCSSSLKAEVSLPTPKGRKLRANPLSIPVALTEEIWELANDKMKDSPTDEKRIDKVGQVFFDVTFSKEEVNTCSVNGKGKDVSRKFDSCKVRFIRAAVAFILLKPFQRTTKAFQKATSGPDFKTLHGNQFDILKKKVLTEYAYRARRKLRNI